MQHGAAAHGAGFERHIEGAAVQPVVAERLRRRAQGHDLGVGGGVVAIDGRVAAGGDHATVLHHDRAHRHFAGVGRRAGFGQRLAHEVRVVESGRVGHAASVGQRRYPTL